MLTSTSLSPLTIKRLRTAGFTTSISEVKEGITWSLINNCIIIQLVRTSYIIIIIFVSRYLPMHKPTKYKEIHNYLKKKIQLGNFQIGEYLPSENDLCRDFSITRTTARKALDGLVRDGYIERQHGKGSCVKERNRSLGLLTVKGFSEAVGGNAKTHFLQKLTEEKWNSEIMHAINTIDLQSKCLYFKRIRSIGDKPVMLEENWFSGDVLPDILDTHFIDGSFFKTLSKKYFIEITGSSQELRAELAREEQSGLLKIKPGSPILHISIKFFTSNPQLTIYSELYCVTSDYPIGNSYFI